MRNMSLLRFLAAVQEHATSTKSLMGTSGYDPLELQIAVGMAMETGFIESTPFRDPGHPSHRLTAAGAAWAADELAGFAPLAHLITSKRMAA